MKYSMNYESPIGLLYIESENDTITQIKKINKIEKENPNSFLFTVQKELKEYFEGNRHSFTFELNPKGTEFQKKVWHTLTKIPYGKVKTYKEIAEEVNCPKGSRAVGNACNQNPILILIPCHRVIGTSGSLTGFALGLEVKEQLLKLEHSKL